MLNSAAKLAIVIKYLHQNEDVLSFIYICSLLIEIECVQLPSEESIERAKRLLDINPVIDGYSTYL